MSDSDTPRKFKIAIVGGGLGGLAFAVTLANLRADVDVDIYESTSSFGELGAGIGAWPRVWDTLKCMGLEDALTKRFGSVADGSMTYCKADQEELVIFGRSTVQVRTYHRAEFLRVLELQIPPHYRTHFGKRLVSYEDDAPDPVILHFKDGTTAECDVLVGADGIKSAVRNAMFTQLGDKTADRTKAEMYLQCVDVRWTGIVIYRSLIPREILEAVCPNHLAFSSPAYFTGKDKSLVVFPISQGRLINCALLRYWPDKRNTTYPGPWVSQATVEELLNEYSGWDPQVTALVKSMKTISKWAVATVEGLPTFVSGRVALLGDAAHAMTTHMASGAGQAFEDALILATLLAQQETQIDTIQRTLEVYDEVRRPFAQHIQDISFELGEVLWMETPGMKHFTAEDSSTGRVLKGDLKTIHEQIVSLHTWTWSMSLMADRDLAIEKLKDWRKSDSR